MPSSTTSSSTTNVADGTTFATVTSAVYSLTPPSLSRIRPPTVRAPSSVVAHDAEAAVPNAPNPAPSPQSKANSNPAAVSALDGSDGPVNDNPIGLPSSTDTGELNVADGATFRTSTVAVYVVASRSSSWTRPPTVRLPSSVVAHDADAVVE